MRYHGTDVLRAHDGADLTRRVVAAQRHRQILRGAGQLLRQRRQPRGGVVAVSCRGAVAPRQAFDVTLQLTRAKMHAGNCYIWNNYWLNRNRTRNRRSGAA